MPDNYIAVFRYQYSDVTLPPKKHKKTQKNKTKQNKAKQNCSMCPCLPEYLFLLSTVRIKRQRGGNGTKDEV